MAGDSKKLQPIIVKRIKQGGHGHHGGAWKIAYADFVTAMMAFFLLMWLLGSTTEGDKKGIADYFSSPMKVALFGGSGAGDASHVLKGGGQDLTRTTGQVKRGEIESERKTVNLKALKDEQIRAEIARLRTLQERIEGELQSNPGLARVQVADPARHDARRPAHPDRRRAEPADVRQRLGAGAALHAELLRAIGAVLAEVPNRLTLEGHTDATPFSGGERGYSNWELSADRANASRRELLAGGLPDDRMLRVQGLAASQLLKREQPDDPANRRISIVVMNREAEDAIFKSQPADCAPAEPSIKPERPTLVSSPAAPGR